ncbi:MAG: hypothetical protein IPQ06_06830 [Chitinophagaceae bacterium]|nr:hypothetical protein [Chitinophagaceae bacterium]
MRKKLLIIPGYKLYPATTGGSYYQLAYIEKQMHDLDISMIITPENVSEEYLEEFCKRFPLVKVIKAGSSNNGRFKKLLKGAIKFFRKTRKGIGREHCVKFQRFQKW